MTLAERRLEKSKSNDLVETTSEASDCLRLDSNDLDRQPILVVQEPTPDFNAAFKKAEPIK